jgi:hypothetical protein
MGCGGSLVAVKYFDKVVRVIIVPMEFQQEGSSIRGVVWVEYSHCVHDPCQSLMR